MYYWNWTPEILYGDRSCTAKPVLSKFGHKRILYLTEMFIVPEKPVSYACNVGKFYGK